MGTITDKLNKLVETKSAIKTAIVNKGVSISDTDTFASYADKIASISGAEDTYGFSDIGFSAVPDRITNGITRAKKILDKVDLTASTWKNAFRNCPYYNSSYSYNDFRSIEGAYFPYIEVPEDSELAKGESEFPDFIESKLETFNIKCRNIAISEQAFRDCVNLTEFRVDGNLKFYNPEHQCCTFSDCPLQKFEVTGTFDISGVILSRLFVGCLCDIDATFIGAPSKIEYTFYNVGKDGGIYVNIPSIDLTGLTSVNFLIYQSNICRVGEIKSQTLTSLSGYYLFGSSYIYRIDCLYADSATSISSLFPNKCYYMLIKNLGMQESCTTADLKGGYWGTKIGYVEAYDTYKQRIIDAVADARQSVIDTLITYSYDRATAGYSTCTVTLHADTKALLTEDEIAQITAKGYTLA